MAGQSIAAASSQAHAAMGAQAETALNSGWILDQTIGAGPTFATAAAPSTATAFLSSGDGTTGTGNSFWTVGRRTRVVHTGGTAYGAVLTAVYGAPVTTVTMEFHPGGTTSLSTTAITTAAVSPLAPGGLLGNTPLPNLALGSSFPSSGLLRLGYSTQAIVGRTSGNVDDVVWPHQISSTTLAANVATTAANAFTTVFTKALNPGTWLITSGMTVQNSAVSNWYAIAQLVDAASGLTIAGGMTRGTTSVESTSYARTVALSAISTLTVATNHRLEIGSDSTATIALAATVGFSSQTPATWFHAVKIG